MPTTDDVFNYVMDTPENTNPNVLRSMLNNLEGGGSGGGVLVVHDDENGVLDKTWQEIFDAATTGIVLLPEVYGEGDGGPSVAPRFLTSAHFDDGDNVYLVAFKEYGVFSSETASGYPVMQS